MNVADLREMIEDLDDNVEVRIAMQPSWPLEYSIDRAILKSEVEPEDPDDDDDEDDGDDVLYLTEGKQIGYASKNLWE